MLMSSEDTSKLFTKVNTKFKCDSSVKSFTLAGNLRVGIKTVHEGQSDYKCDSCDKGQIYHKSGCAEANFLWGGTTKQEKKYSGKFANF